MNVAIGKVLKNQQLIKVLIFLMCLVCVWPILFAPIFVSADGPCHVQGAAIFRDLIVHGNASYYAKYAAINNEAFTNWGSVVSLGILQLFFAPLIAEKIFLVFCIIVFVLGFVKSIVAIKKQFNLVLVLIPIIATNLILQFGFYNYYLGLAIGWCTVYFFTKAIISGTKKSLGLLALFSTITFLCHPLSFVFTCILVCLFYFFVKTTAQVAKQKITFSIIFSCFIAFLPSLILLSLFVLQQRNAGSVANTTTLLELWQHLCKGQTLQQFSKAENPFISVILIALCILAIMALCTSVKSTLAVLCSIAVSLLAYFFLPNELFAGGAFSLRLQLFIFTLLMLLVCISEAHVVLQILPICICIFAYVQLSNLRTVCAQKMSTTVQQLYDLTNKLPNRKNIAYLSFAGNALNAYWEKIIDNQFLLTHIVCGIGTIKKSVVPDNILMSTNYYPVIWKKDCDVEKATLHQNQGANVLPAPVNIDMLHQRLDIQFIITYAATSDVFEDTVTNRMWQNVQQRYEKIGHSEGGVWRLYKRR
jgi:hypothetical protein